MPEPTLVQLRKELRRISKDLDEAEHDLAYAAHVVRKLEGRMEAVKKEIKNLK